MDLSVAPPGCWLLFCLLNVYAISRVCNAGADLDVVADFNVVADFKDQPRMVEVQKSFRKPGASA
jgi:hypothetical protein